MSYQLYKPLRNQMRQFSLLQSLGVIRAYMQHLQFDQSFPNDVEVDRVFLESSGVGKMVFEWELELLARELILNAPDDAATDLRSWKNFASAVNKLKDLENNISADPAYRPFYQKNILLELYRLAHRQFPWQRKPNKDTITRYLKIFSHPAVDPIVTRELGMTAQQMYALGLAMTGHYLNQFGIDYPFNIEISGLTKEHAEQFVQHFAIEIDELRTKMAEQQSYDQDFAYTMNPLMITPLVWVMLRGKKTLIAPIPTYVLRRFTEGVYYEICNADGFSAAFGASFQQYVGEVLAATTRDTSFSVLREQQYRIGKEQKDSVDWILADDTATLFLECKTKKIRYGAKIGLAETSILDEDLEKMAGFVVQVYKTLADAEAGLYTHWKPNGKPIYPIIVTLEEWYAFGDLIMAAIDQRVRDAMGKAGLDLGMMERYPYSICSVEDLEHVAGVMSRIGIETFMHHKHEGEHRLWTFGSFTYKYYQEEMKKRGELFPGAAKMIHPDL